MVNLHFLSVIAVLLVSSVTSQVQFSVYPNNVTGPWTHYFSECVGSGHAALALRADWQQQMKQTHEELGVRQVRFHGLFVDDMSVVLPGDTGGILYSFYNIDQIFDYLLKIGMKPLVELSFMPSLLASGNQTWSHYEANVTPPKNWSMWEDLIKAFASHLVDRYGIDEIKTWNFEVWNEPNCCPNFFWTGTQEDYFTLFQVTSSALKSISPLLRVGGPATAMSAWIPDFMNFCSQNNVLYDFISTHEYPTDPPGPETRQFFSDVLKKTRKTVGTGIPIYYTEYDDGYNDDTSYGAAFVIYQIFSVNGVVDTLSWWVFSDLFEEAGMRSDPFSDVWLPVDGLLNVYGIPKPNYRAFQLLHWTGNSLVKTTPDFNYYDTVGVFAVTGNKTSIFVVNWNVKQQPCEDQAVQITVHGVNLKSRAIMYRIDDTHGNAFPLWVKMGKPFYLKESQIHALKNASELVAEPAPFVVQGNSIVFTVIIPANTVINIIVQDPQ